MTQVSRECERGTSLADWLSLGDSSYKRFIGKKLGKNKFTKNPSHFVLTQVSRECEGKTSQAGWLSLGDSSYKGFIGKRLSENKFTKKIRVILF